jgi:tetratricopeptide (TPR) repeat protein
MIRVAIVVSLLSVTPSMALADRVKPTLTLRLYKEAQSSIAAAQRARDRHHLKKEKSLLETAAQKLKQALANDRKFVRAAVSLGHVLYRLRQSKEAARLLTRALKASPGSVAIKHVLSLHLMNLGRLKRAVTLLEEVVRRNRTKYFDALYILTGHFYAKRRFRKALGYARTYLKIRPRDAGIHGVVGNIYMRKGQLKKAFKSFNKVLKYAPKNHQVRVNIGNIYFKQKKYPLAIAVYQRVLKDGIKLAAVHFNLASSFFSLKKWSKAAKQFEAFSRLRPRHAKGHYHTGRAYVRAGKREKARTAFGRSVKLDDQDPWALFELAKIALSENDLASAERDIGEAIKRAPNTGSVLRLGGIIARKQKQYRIAVKRLKAAAAMSPGDAVARAELGHARFLNGDVDEGINDLETARTIDAGSKRARSWLAVARTHRGITYVKQNKPALAESDFRRAFEVNPLLTEASWNFGLLMDRLGRLGDALSQIEAALSLRSRTPNLHLLKAYLLARSGKFSNAQETLKMARDSPEIGLRWIVQAAIHSNAGEYNAAVEALKQARKHGAMVSQALIVARLAQVSGWLRSDRTDTAIRELTRIGRLRNNRLESLRSALLGLGLIRKERDFQRIIRLLNKVAQTSPPTGWGIDKLVTDVPILIGYAHYRLGHPRRALKHLQTFLTRHPKSDSGRKLTASILQNMAERDHAARRYYQAARAIRQAQRLTPEDSRIRHNEACVRYSMGEHRAAAQVFRSLHETRTAGVTNATLNLALYLDDVAGQGSKAVPFYRQYLKSNGTAKDIARKRLRRKEAIFGP